MDGQALKELRKETNTTQLEVAKFLDYTVKGKPNRSMIARFENGHAKINSRLAILLKMFFSDKKKDMNNE